MSPQACLAIWHLVQVHLNATQCFSFTVNTKLGNVQNLLLVNQKIATWILCTKWLFNKEFFANAPTLERKRAKFLTVSLHNQTLRSGSKTIRGKKYELGESRAPMKAMKLVAQVI